MSKASYEKRMQSLLSDNAISSYLERLSSARSRNTMTCVAHVIVRNLLQLDEFFKWDYLSEELTTRLFSELASQHYSPTTLKTYLYCLKGIAERLWVSKRLQSDEYMLIQKVKPVRGSRLNHGRMLTKEELKKLFDYYDRNSEPINVRDSAIFAVMYFCGLRRSEVIGLRIENISLDPVNPYMRLIGKGNKERVINIPPSAIKRLGKWLDMRSADKGILFTRITRYGEIDESHAISGSLIYKICTESAQKAGIDNWSPHDARRTCASQLLSAGVDIVTVRDYLGHSSINTTKIYDKRSEDRLQDVARKFDLGID